MISLSLGSKQSVVYTIHTVPSILVKTLSVYVNDDDDDLYVLYSVFALPSV